MTLNILIHLIFLFCGKWGKKNLCKDSSEIILLRWTKIVLKIRIKYLWVRKYMSMTKCSFLGDFISLRLTKYLEKDQGF